ncbi:MAG: NAD(P)/FAD-dependent oxidoreductase [Verrucomicrobiota bacterium]
MSKQTSKIIIAGAGPAGLTAAAECQEHGMQVEIYDKDPSYVGGISRTVEYKGYRFDIGGHRFFSKSSEITDWWRKRLPDDFIRVKRLSRIFYRKKFFDYPLKASNALLNLGIFTSFLCVASYIKARLFPIRPEKSFADWVTNRFGKRLFNIFFKTYTEKVWGLPCEEISADWAAQRIKGLSLIKAVLNALLPQMPSKDGSVIKTLIDEFEYPRLGPGMMWEKTRDDIISAGGSVHMNAKITRINRESTTAKSISSITFLKEDGTEHTVEANSFIISIPLRETVLAFEPPLAESVNQAARKLKYRDFLTVALMVRKTNLFPDNWIYIHDPSVKLGRIQNFNNWSQELVPEPNTTCIGLEYFCFEGDGLWTMADEDLIHLGKKEVSQLGLVDEKDVFDGCVVRMEKAYPVYDPGYQENINIIREQLAKLDNLQVIGRNGMHKYNNQDHSMMTALLAARNLSKQNENSFDLWRVNTDAEYHEEASDHSDKAGRLIPSKLNP